VAFGTKLELKEMLN